EACARLNACGADAELVQLASSCLAPAKEDRPANGEAVAAAMARYQSALQQRMQQAQIERASSQARAEEEQRRHQVERHKRRLTVALAAALIVVVLGGSGAALWLQQDQAERARRHDLGEQAMGQALLQAAKVHDAVQTQLAEPGGVFELLNKPGQW